MDGDEISLEVIKKAEKEDCLVIRLVETSGMNSKGLLKFNSYPVTLFETNLIEWEDYSENTINSDTQIELNPFEIRTYKLKTSLKH